MTEKDQLNLNGELNLDNLIIPQATVKRLPLYYRYLTFLLEDGVTRINSGELSDAVQVDSATIRRDFSYFGSLGKRGYGYDVESLLGFFKKILSQDRLTSVALVGIGNMGQALLNYNFRQTNNIRISAGFDINPEIVGKVVSGVPIYSVNELKKQLSDQQIDVAILTVPVTAAQSTTDKLVEAGIRGILNFTPLRLVVPSSVHTQNVDLATELQALIFLLQQAEK